MKAILSIGLCALIVTAVLHVGSGPPITPEMIECMQLHGLEKEYSQVLSKYSDPEISGHAAELSAVEDPQVIRIERSGEVVCYQVEGFRVDPDSRAPVTLDYSVCWQNRRIVALDLKSPGCPSL